MKSKQILCGVAFLLFGCPSFNVQAQKACAWSASQCETRPIDVATYDSIQKCMKQSVTVSLQFHSANCSWGETDIRLFSDIMSMKEYGFRDSTYAARQLNVLKETVEHGLRLSQGHDTPLILHVWLNKVSKLAGMQIDLMMVYKDSIPVYRASLSIPDGRWNDFSTLFVENSEKLVKNLRRKLNDVVFYKKEGEWLISKSREN